MAALNPARAPVLSGMPALGGWGQDSMQAAAPLDTGCMAAPSLLPRVLPTFGDQTAEWGQQQVARTAAEGEAAPDLRLSAGRPHLLYLMLSSE